VSLVVKRRAPLRSEATDDGTSSAAAKVLPGPSRELTNLGQIAALTLRTSSTFSAVTTSR